MPLTLPGLGALALSLALAGFVASRPEPARVPARVTLVGTIEEALGASTDLEPRRIDAAWFAGLSAAQRRFLVPTQAPVWERTFDVPAGTFTFRARVDDVVYGAAGRIEGPPLELHLEAPRKVRFLYSHETHAVMADASKPVAIASGTFQRQLGCTADWQDDCLRAWLQDDDEDGQFSLVTRLLAKGEYQVRPAAPGFVTEPLTKSFKVLRDAEEVRFVWRPGTSEVLVEFPGGRAVEEP